MLFFWRCLQYLSNIGTIFKATLTTKITRTKTKKLELHLDILNEEIRKVNGSGDRSPRFMQDLWRGSKGHNPRSQTKTYTDLSLLERDGVHPKKILARLWLRRIATKILTDCFSKIPANQLWQSKK
jgi:hypothetical protein